MTAVVWPHRASPFNRSLDPSAGDPARGNTPAAANQARAAAATSASRTIRIVMAGGGTGGHLYPGLAVAEALQEKIGARLELCWAATARPVDQRLLSQFGDHYIAQPVQPLVKQVSKLWPFWKAWRESCAYWKDCFANTKIDAVLALGGYAAGPAAHVAARFGIPVGLLNPDALPGLANRFLLKRADRIFCQWPLPPALVTRVRGRVMPLGCPIRPSLLQRTRVEAAQRLGLDAARPTLVVTGASLGAKTINDAVINLLRDDEFGAALHGTIAGSPTTRLAQWQVLHLAGMEQVAAVKMAYEPIDSIVHKVLDYCDDMASVWAVADIAIARAGASTCAELTACGVPAILLPYPYHRDHHQRHNALQLVGAGGAILVDDRKDAAPNAAAIKSAVLPLLYDPVARQRLAAAARRAGKPHAARDIADEMLALLPA